MVSRGHCRGSRPIFQCSRRNHAAIIQLAGALVAEGWIFVHGLADDGFEFRRNFGIERPDRSRLTVQDRIEQRGDGSLMMRTFAGGHFVQDDAARVQVGAAVHIL